VKRSAVLAQGGADKDLLDFVGLIVRQFNQVLLDGAETAWATGA